MTELEAHLRRASRKLLVPYVMGGIPDAVSFPAALAAVSMHADAVEVGLPFSDPLMDGPVIASAGERALQAGIGPLEVLELAGDAAAPRVLMTYYNPIHRTGEVAFCERAVGRRFAGLIVPDLPLEESEPLRAAARDVGLAWVPLVAPTTSADRAGKVAETATGFVYAVSTLGVTGTRERLSERAATVVERCRDATDLPVLVGIGVSTAAQAVAAAAVADGVVTGSAVVKTLLEEGIEATAAFLKDVRAALDARDQA